MFGVRYTTARHTAEQAIDAVFCARGVSAPPSCRTAQAPVVGGDVQDKRRFAANLLESPSSVVSPSTLQRLATMYGTRQSDVTRLAAEPGLNSPLSRDCHVTAAEVAYAVREEFAVTLSDAVIRRTEAGAAGRPDDEALANAALVMARELGWDDERVSAEIADVRKFYELAI
jgi:glycerol-3-phosphate dehydrogenase